MNKKTRKKDVEKFLTELSDISKKYGIFIHGCGCCGSPSLYTEGYNYIGEHLHFEKDEKTYSVVLDGEKRVK